MIVNKAIMATEDEQIKLLWSAFFEADEKRTLLENKADAELRRKEGIINEDVSNMFAKAQAQIELAKAEYEKTISLLKPYL